MPNYIATFHTHLAAMRSSRSLKGRAETVALSPVPRALSSSCGTCVRYTAADDCREAMDVDLESIALSLGDEKYQLIYRAEE
ncbi:MAG: DUF3343 domain-containing protein [Clostridia bacterium]|nr:DUF3343 domain-containing protein [Clostridia bacterium]MBQ6704118.1 DUF3343 domain-containing protein [Clostridia bacterium]